MTIFNRAGSGWPPAPILLGAATAVVASEGEPLMKKICAGFLGLTLTSAMALSAKAADWYGGPQGPACYKDVPYVAVTWTGFYAGVNGGGGWSQLSDQLINPTYSPFPGLSPEGGFGGGQIGYNWQGLWGYSRLVLGIEADIQISTISDENYDSVGNVFRSKLEDFGTVRGRVGYALDRTLIYFTGGLAYGTIRNEADIPGVGDFLASTTAAGYVLGGGLEYKFNPSLSIKGEYQYLDLGKNNPTDPIAGTYTANGGTVRDDAFHTLRIGLNWFPFPASEPLK